MRLTEPKVALVASTQVEHDGLEEYLKENERYTTAALIIMGGWIEAIHIAINVAI